MNMLKSSSGQPLYSCIWQLLLLESELQIEDRDEASMFSLDLSYVSGHREHYSWEQSDDMKKVLTIDPDQAYDLSLL